MELRIDEAWDTLVLGAQDHLHPSDEDGEYRGPGGPEAVWVESDTGEQTQGRQESSQATK